MMAAPVPVCTGTAIVSLWGIGARFVEWRMAENVRPCLTLARDGVTQAISKIATIGDLDQPLPGDTPRS